jgi:monooxygenase
MEREHVDVLIVGAGLSGVGAACRLKEKCPGKTYTVLEARERIGGTWDLFRYPGIRSDTDMFTMGYPFRPWGGRDSVTDGGLIRDYIRETARERGVEERIRFKHRAVRAEWSTREARWTVEVERGDSGESERMTCGFLFMCSGYYRYDEGYAPEFPGRERFAGPVVHPQRWDGELEYAGKRVAVIGSGATAVTLVPAMAESAEHVTMVQRSPTYVVSIAAEDPLAKALRRVLPANAVYAVMRWKSVLLMMLSYRFARSRPKAMKAMLRRGLERQLPEGYDIERHFTPKYEPWDQRLCVVPDGDLFKAIKAGRASVVTGRIESFTERGLLLASGEEVEADVIVTATGFELEAFGGMTAAVDGCEVNPAETMSYKGMMLSGVPNFALATGYTNASWTLKADLTSEYVCRLLNHMDARGYRQCTPHRDPTVEEQPFIDLTSGFVQRSIDKFPKQGAKAPWRLRQNYPLDLIALRFGAIEDGALRFAGAGTTLPATTPVPAAV